jgi:2-keto-4-pentenoate hydratase
MGRDMPAHVGHYSREDVSQAVVAAFAGLEICDSRFKDPNRQPIGNVIADNSYASLIVLGDRLQLEDVASYPVTLTTLAAPATTGNSRAVFGDPMLSLCWLANWLSDRGCGLKAGQYVAAGNCTGLTHADANDRCVARFGDLASVHCAFSA